MRIQYRKIISTTLITVFFISAPIVVLFTMGYRYNWQKHKMEKTGILRLVSLPSEATIRLNDAQTHKETPASFTRLLPEDYRIRVEKEGYLPWEKTLTVRSEETTFAKNIELFRDTLPRLVKAVDVLAASPSPDGTRFAVVSEEDGWVELAIDNIDDESEHLLARFRSGTIDAIELSWSPGGAHLLLTAEQDGEPVSFLYPFTDQGSSFSVHTLLPDMPQTLRWSDSDHALTAITRIGVFAISIDDDSLQTGLLSPAAIDGVIIGDDAYLLIADGRRQFFARQPLESPTGPETLMMLTKGEYAFSDISGPFLILENRTGNPTVFYDTVTGSMTEVDHAHTLIMHPEDPSKFLLCDDFEVSLLDIGNRTREVITRIGTPINDCAWSPEAGYALFATRSSVTAIELDQRHGRNTVILVAFSHVGDFVVREDVLLFAGAAGNRKGIYERSL